MRKKGTLAEHVLTSVEQNPTKDSKVKDSKVKDNTNTNTKSVFDF